MRAYANYRLPIAASLFAVVFAIPVLGDAFAVLLGAGLQALSDSAALALYALTHLTTGAGVLAAGGIGIVAVRKRSEPLLLAGELLGIAMFAAILILELTSRWGLRYFE